MARKSTAGRMKVAIAFLLTFGPAFLLVFMSTRGCRHKFKTLDDFGAAKKYEITDSRGIKMTSADFDGKIGPSDPLLIMIGAICSTPFLLLFIILRRPKLAHIVRLQNVEIGSTAHLISPSTLFQTPYRPADLAYRYPPLRW